MRYFTPDGIRLAYDVVGAGPPLILHTGAGGDSRMWREAGYVDGLHGYEVILLDHRGHGASDAPADPAAYGIEQYVADVVGLADELGHERFAFWGYSNGGRVGYALAAAHTDRVTALVASGVVDAPDESPDEWREAARVIREQGLGATLDDEPMPAWLQAILVDETDAEVVARELDGFAHWSPWTVFPRVAAPTLIVAGEQEAEHVEDAAARIPRGRSSVLPGLGHVGAFVSSSLVLPHVRSFLEVCTHD
jgi:pimeloyl-ACP methyl ester carboxylesterase